MKSTRNKASRLLQWRTLGSGLLALSLLFTGVSASASSIGLVTSSSGSLEISSDLNVIGGDAAGGAHATLIAPDLQVCDERTAMVSRFDATGDLQVCKETGAVDAEGNPIWDWQTHQVVGSNIATGAVGETQIANDAVAQQHVRADAVGGDQIRASSITGLKLIENAIQSRELASNAVGTTHIAADAVTNEKIADNAVSTAQIAANAITSAKIADGAVGTTQLATGAVTSDKIGTGAVTNAKVADSTLSESKLGFTLASEMTNEEFMAHYQDALANCEATGKWRIPNSVADALGVPRGLEYDTGNYYHETITLSMPAISASPVSLSQWNTNITGPRLIINANGQLWYIPSPQARIDVRGEENVHGVCGSYPQRDWAIHGWSAKDKRSCDRWQQYEYYSCGSESCVDLVQYRSRAQQTAGLDESGVRSAAATPVYQCN